MTEKQLQNNIINWLKRKDILCHKNHGGKIYLKINNELNEYNLKAGFADLEVFENGIVIFLELKSDVGKISISQKQNFQKLYDSGFTNNVFVVKPKHWKLIQNSFKETNSFHKSLELIIGKNQWMKLKEVQTKTK